jgi:hypothetical protein
MVAVVMREVRLVAMGAVPLVRPGEWEPVVRPLGLPGVLGVVFARTMSMPRRMREIGRVKVIVAAAGDLAVHVAGGAADLVDEGADHAAQVVALNEALGRDGGRGRAHAVLVSQVGLLGADELLQVSKTGVQEFKVLHLDEHLQVVIFVV